MINLEEITVFNDLRERLAQITPAQIAAVERRFRPAAGAVIGVVESVTTRAVYALWINLEVERDLEKARAKGASEEMAEQEHLQRAALLDIFADVAKELFWAQAKIDLGFLEIEGVGLRKGWQLIRHSGALSTFSAMLQELE